MDKEWYYLTDNNEEVGPFTIDEICSKLENSDIPVDIPVKKQNEPGWTPANKHPDFHVISNENPQEETIINIEKEDKYKKVGGWLLLFIIGTGILTPIINLYYIYQAFEMMANYDLVANAQAFVITHTIITFIIFVIFAITTGYKLFKIAPGAVKFAKVYLVTAVIINLILAISPYLFGLESKVAFDNTIQGLKDTFRTAIVAIIWFSYLKISKRVSITYDLGRY